jgi:hypothetical protein
MKSESLIAFRVRASAHSSASKSTNSSFLSLRCFNSFTKRIVFMCFMMTNGVRDRNS